MNYLMGLDIGTSSTRTIIIDENGELIASATADYPLYTPRPGWAEQNPKDWYDAAISTIKEAMQKADITGKDIAAIGPSGQMHGSVFLDKNGSVIRPAILWNDQRTQRQCDRIYEIFGYEGFIKLSYNKALTGFTAPKILWLMENEPENYKKTTKILLPKDYIRFMLSGTYATEVSDASGMLLMDIKRRSWSDEILGGLKIDINLLSDIYESEQVCSYVDYRTAKLTGLLKGTPIVGGGGDNAAGNVGAGVICEGIISDSIGTSGVIFAHCDRPAYDSQGRLHSFCHAVKGKWHLMGVTLAAAGSLKWFFDAVGPSREIEKQFPQEKKYKIFDREAENVSPGSDGLIFLPYISGERTPYADPYARGVFFGLSYLHRHPHFVRSIMEGVAFSQLDCLNLMKETGIDSSKIIMMGGGSRSKIWKEIICDIFETKVSGLKNEEGPAFGAALLAGIGCGIYKDAQQAADRAVRQTPEIMPDKQNSKTYRKTYRIYKSLYKSLKNDFKLLYDMQFND